MKEKFKSYFMITLATLLVSVGIYFFKFPNNFSTGGVAGVSIILSALFPQITSATYSMIINLFLLLIGFVVIGKDFGIKTAYASALQAVSVYVFELIFPITEPITNQPLMELVYSIIISAFGSALLFDYDASTGGTDIIAMIIKKYSNINISNALFYADIIIVMATFFVFGIQTWLFSLLAFLAKVFIMNNVIKNIRLSKFCTVIVNTEYVERVCEYITKELHKTATVGTEYTGAFDHEKKAVLLVALGTKQAEKLKKFVKSLDKQSFVVVTETSEISGKGFRDMI